MSAENLATVSLEDRHLGFDPLPATTLGDLLETVVLFRKLDREEIDRLADFVVGYRVEENTELIREGAQQQLLLILVQGRISITKGEGEGARQLMMVRDGGFLGEMSLLDGAPASATATTTAASDVLMLRKERFEMLCEESPRLGIKVVKDIAFQLSQRLRRTSSKLAEHL